MAQAAFTLLQSPGCWDYREDPSTPASEVHFTFKVKSIKGYGKEWERGGETGRALKETLGPWMRWSER